VHGLIAPGSTASALALPYAWVIVGLFVAIGGTSITSAVIAALMGGD
jgi:hydrogenase-4 membrane subunit HyfE